MSMTQPVYRVDTFTMPEMSKTPFLEKVQLTHDLLMTLPGFVRDAVIERRESDSRVKIMTIVEWENPRAMAAAAEQVKTKQQQSGFDRNRIFQQLAIEAEFGVYEQLIL